MNFSADDSSVDINELELQGLVDSAVDRYREIQSSVRNIDQSLSTYNTGLYFP